MTTPTDWLLASIIMVLLYFVILLADNILLKGMGVGRKLWRQHIVDEFPYPDECWGCKLATCSGCEVSRGWKDEMSRM